MEKEKEKEKRKTEPLILPVCLSFFRLSPRPVLNLPAFSGGRRSFSVRRRDSGEKTTAEVTVECGGSKKYQE